jgi:hypothetical protein
MDRRGFLITAFACGAGISSGLRSRGQTGAIEPDLAKLAEGNGFRIYNRTASSLRDGLRNGACLSEAPGDGVAYLEGIEFANGAIELDIRGKDVQQQSFAGVAFYGADGAIYEAVYFRPFNFRTEDPARRIRAVQYISHPTYPWQKLRAEHPGKYEKAVTPAPDPNGWSHARVVIASPNVSVFVERAKEPSLVIRQLSERAKGRIGLWVGNNSGGDFANLRLMPA